MRRRGLTLVEVMVGIVFFATLSYFLYTLLSMSARRSAAGDKKNQTVRAAFDVTGRLRRDLKWAIRADVGNNGASLVLHGADQTKRTWSFDASTRTLTLPAISQPTASYAYPLAKFQRVEFSEVSGAAMIRYVFSVLPGDIPAGGPSQNDLKYSSIVCGEVVLRRAQGMSHFPEWRWPGTWQN